MSQKYFCFAILFIFANLPKFRCEKTNESENPIEVIKYKISINFTEASLEETHFFEGVTDIIFKNYNLEETINLHAKKLFFKKIYLYGNDSQLITGFHAKNIKSDNFTGVLILNVTSKLEKNAQYKLRFWYTGTLSSKEEEGFYRSTFKNRDMERSFLGVISLAPNNAQKVFPCFNETKYSAEFDWELTYPKKYSVLGPTNIKQERKANEMQSFAFFEITPRVPLQSLVFVFSELFSDFICSFAKPEDIPVAVCSRNDVAFSTSFALETAQKILKFLDKFVELESLHEDKVMLFAVPDFAGSPKGNLRLLTFRESDLLWDHENGSEDQKQHILKTITKGLVESWLMAIVKTNFFGKTNCIDDFVRNGLVTFLEYHIANKTEPDFEFDEQFDIDHLFTVVGPDITPSIELFEGEKPFELFTSNQKMKIFEYAAATYFRRQRISFYRFYEVYEKKLFNCNFYSDQPFAPVLIDRYRFDDVMTRGTLIYSNVPRGEVISNFNFKRYILEVVMNDFSISNVTLHGEIFKRLDEIDRARYVDSLFTESRCGRTNYSDFFYFCCYLKNDTLYYTWKVAFPALSSILEMIQNETKKTQFQEFVRDLIQPVYKSVLEDKSDKIFMLKRAMVYWYACKFGFEDCIRRAVDDFTAYKTQGIKPDKNLRQSVYCYGLKYSKDIENDWKFLWSELLKTKVQSEADIMTKSLGCVSDVKILRKYLEQTIASDSLCMRRDVFSIISAVYEGSPEGARVASWFYFHHYDKLDEYYDRDAVVSMLRGLFKKITTQDLIDEWKNFTTQLHPVFYTAISESVLALFDRKLWFDRKSKEIEEEMDKFFNTKYKLV